ncbi:hypothetical protein SAMN05421747_102175 [Parapedobacter composti]|uniref:Uncharacterized protein n=1 Tax=Parapedobacter composti TaxID=623281 RepID=A0A1I1F258_9SPHI|nr:hypothetical protein SAMN05421747_102175 [Parapedobacter composti]
MKLTYRKLRKVFVILVAAWLAMETSTDKAMSRSGKLLNMR